MTRSTIEDIDVDALVDQALVQADGGAFTFGPERGGTPFDTATVDDRLAEIDALYEAPGGAVTFAARPPADANLVAPPVRELPGGDAFAELAGPAAAFTFGPWARVKELYRRVQAFLTRLREGVLGFRRELVRDPALVVTLASSLDSDVDVEIQATAVTDETTGQIVGGLAATRAAITDALALFAKVVELVAKLIKCATSPLLAVRALWKALTALYEVLVRHFAERGEPGVDPS